METMADFAAQTITPWLDARLPGRTAAAPSFVLGDVVVDGDNLLDWGFGTVPGGAWSSPSYGLCLQALGATIGARPYGLETVVVDSGRWPIYVLQVRTPVHEPVVPTPKSRRTGSEAASIASEVRVISGLSVRKLAEIFPVERESFQRWLSGEQTPSSANLERLLALRHFLQALAQRVGDPKSWLLAPLYGEQAAPSAYDVLRSGNLTDLWAAISALPGNAPRRTYLSEEGGFATVVEGSLRGRDYRASEEELDDYAELFDDAE